MEFFTKIVLLSDWDVIPVGCFDGLFIEGFLVKPVKLHFPMQGP